MSINLITDSLLKAFEDLDNAKTKKEVRIAVDKATSKSKLAKEVNSVLKIKLEVVKSMKSGEVHIPNLGADFGLKLEK